MERYVIKSTHPDGGVSYYRCTIKTTHFFDEALTREVKLYNTNGEAAAQAMLLNREAPPGYVQTVARIRKDEKVRHAEKKKAATVSLPWE